MINMYNHLGIHLETLLMLPSQGHQPTRKIQAVTESTDGSEERQSKLSQFRNVEAVDTNLSLFQKSQKLPEPL